MVNTTNWAGNAPIIEKCDPYAEINQFLSVKLATWIIGYTDRYLFLVCSAYARISRKIRGHRDTRRKDCLLLLRPAATYSKEVT